MTTEYNGWTNKPTWLIKLWIDNDQGEQEFWLSQAKDTMSVRDMEQGLQNYFEQSCELIGESNFYADLMAWALAMVNWNEIAKALIEDAEELLA